MSAIFLVTAHCRWDDGSETICSRPTVEAAVKRAEEYANAKMDDLVSVRVLMVEAHSDFGPIAVAVFEARDEGPQMPDELYGSDDGEAQSAWISKNVKRVVKRVK